MSQLNLPTANTQRGLGLELTVATLILVGMAGVFFWLQRAAPTGVPVNDQAPQVEQRTSSDATARPKVDTPSQ